MMDDNDITELAKGMVPFVRECVSDAYSKTAVPPELAERVALAVRMLHESPPLEQRSEASPSPRVTRIERTDDGSFVPVYETQP